MPDPLVNPPQLVASHTPGAKPTSITQSDYEANLPLTIAGMPMGPSGGLTLTPEAQAALKEALVSKYLSQFGKGVLPQAPEMLKQSGTAIANLLKDTSGAVTPESAIGAAGVTGLAGYAGKKLYDLLQSSTNPLKRASQTLDSLGK